MSALKRKADTQLEKISQEIVNDNVESSPIKGASEVVSQSVLLMQPGSLIEDSMMTIQETEVEPVENNPDLMDVDAPAIGDPLVEESSLNELPPTVDAVEQSSASSKVGVPEPNVRVAPPKKIKHPSSAWMIFSSENREKIQKEQPSLTFTEGSSYCTPIVGLR
jgi:HMG (high mobility group) box